MSETKPPDDLVPQRALDWFAETFEEGGEYCINCFAPRDPDKDSIFYRSVGLNPQRQDIFCGCGAGQTGGGRDLRSDIEVASSSISPRFESELAGTISREWDRGEPLALAGKRVSFVRCLYRLLNAAKSEGYEVDDDRERLRELVEQYKQDPDVAAFDREIFAAILWRVTDAEEQLDAEQEEAGGERESVSV